MGFIRHRSLGGMSLLLPKSLPLLAFALRAPVVPQAIILAVVILTAVFATHGLAQAPTVSASKPLLSSTTSFDRATRPNTLLQVQMSYQRDQDRTFDSLRGELLPIIDAHLGEAAVAVVDLQTGERFHINGQALHVAGSVIKVYIGLSAWRSVQDGLLPLDTVDGLLSEVFVSQSNAAAASLAQMVGFEAINEEMRRFGAHYSVLTHHPGYVAQQARGYVANSNLTTALDSIGTLAVLWHGAALSLETSHAFLERLDSTLNDFGLAGGLPPQARITRKIGWITPNDADTYWLNADAVNDIAIVRFDREGATHAYAIGVFIQRNLDQLAAWQLTKKISTIVWDFFAEERYPLDAMPPIEAG